MRLIIFLFAVIGSGHALASVGPEANVNFSYRITGDKLAAPFQVFDSKGKTYLQVRDIGKPPTVFDENGYPVPYIIESPYIVLPRVYQRLTARYGKNREAQISGVSQGWAQPERKTGWSFWRGQAKPATVTGFAATPVQAMNEVAQPPKSKLGMLGAFSIEKDAHEPDKPVPTKNRPEDETQIVFSIPGKKVPPAQVVGLSKFISSGKYSSFRLEHANTQGAKERALIVRMKMKSMGVDEDLIQVSERPGLALSAVAVIGEKK